MCLCMHACVHKCAFLLCRLTSSKCAHSKQETTGKLDNNFTKQRPVLCMCVCMYVCDG